MYFKANKYALSALLAVIAASALVLPFLISDGAAEPGSIYTPMLWLLFAASSLIAVKKTEKGKRQKSDVKSWALYAALLFLALCAVIGLFEGFGRNTADCSVSGFLKNMFVYAVPPVCCETVRAAAVNGCGKKKKQNVAMCAETSVILALSQIDVRKLADGLKTFSGVLEQVGGQLVPALAVSAMLTVFAVYAGSAPGIIYRLLTVLPFYILPVLPQNSWLSRALIGCFVPLVILLLMSYGMGQKSRAAAKRERKKDRPWIWITALSALMLVILFFSGTMKYQPCAVEDPNMSPVINAGDMVVIDKTEKAKKELEPGNIVGYARDGRIIFRRIAAVSVDGGQPVYLVCCDDGYEAEKITQERITGCVTVRLPFLGRLMFRTDSGQSEEINTQA